MLVSDFRFLVVLVGRTVVLRLMDLLVGAVVFIGEVSSLLLIGALPLGQEIQDGWQSMRWQLVPFYDRIRRAPHALYVRGQSIAFLAFSFLFRAFVLLYVLLVLVMGLMPVTEICS